MANTFIPKRSSVAGKVPLTTDLQTGEIAVNLADRKIYSKDAAGNVISLCDIGYTPLNVAGGTMTGPLTLPASVAASAPLKLPHGTAPTAPVNGDVWSTTASLLAQINGATRTFIHNGNPTTLASDIAQAEAEAGTSTTRRWFTALRVRQAVAAYAPPKSDITALQEKIDALTARVEYLEKAMFSGIVDYDGPIRF